MAMATIFQLPHAASASSELRQTIMTKSSRIGRMSVGRLKMPSPYLRFYSCRRSGVGILFVARSSADAQRDVQNEHVGLDNCDTLPRLTEVARETEIEIKSSLAKLMAKMQLAGLIFSLVMVVWVRVAAAAVTGSPIDGKKKEFLTSSWPVTTPIVLKSSKRDIGENLGGKSHPGRIQRYGAALAAEMDETDEQTRREYEEWRATPYALTVPLRLVGLRGSVPPVWLKDFASSQGKRVKVVAEFQGNLQNIFTELSTALANQQQLTPKSVLAADLVTIGDSWLGKAVSRGLITPVKNAEKYEWFQRLGTKWQTFLRRNQSGDVDPNGEVYAVPYRWGSVVIAYNSKKFKQHGISAIEDWEDLWRPELAGKIAMISSSRDVIGAVLKSLGASYNVRDFETDVPGGRQAVREKFLRLQQQVRVFDSIQYLKTLGAGDVWVAVGWSGDVIPFAKRTSNIFVMTPRSGTSLWADLWAIPATPPSSTKVGGRIRGPSPLIHQWLDFCLQSTRAKSFEGDVFVGASPLVLAGKPSAGASTVDRALFSADSSRVPHANDIATETGEEEKPSASGKDSLSLSQNQLERNEFLEPLSPAASRDFHWLLSTSSEVPKFQLKSLADKFQLFLNRRSGVDT